ncbi:hypothetical protein [Jejubacter calystegiae]|uniref:hypothetical protein n=1 Tax=Jejubacter calystegiae TaxID=2579935 RepID=UPI00143D0AE0|nr:hypothetical protein [Jejubacter calystegiae]
MLKAMLSGSFCSDPATFSAPCSSLTTFPVAFLTCAPSRQHLAHHPDISDITLTYALIFMIRLLSRPALILHPGGVLYALLRYPCFILKPFPVPTFLAVFLFQRSSS